jgi:hypothetical protein
MSGTIHPAAWQVRDDDGIVRLQIELGNDYAVVLSVGDDGEKPQVCLYHGSGYGLFQHYDVVSFMEWLSLVLQANGGKPG